MRTCTLKFFNAYFPGEEKVFWDEIILEPIIGYRYKNTEKRFAEYFGKTYEVFRN